MFLLNNSIHKVHTYLKLNLGQVIFANSTVLQWKYQTLINMLTIQYKEPAKLE